jgi:hypothetical protein
VTTYDNASTIPPDTPVETGYASGRREKRDKNAGEMKISEKDHKRGE